MKDGDLVRFRAPHWLGGAGIDRDKRPWLVGLLIKYEKWEEIATIMYNNKLIRIPAYDVQKYGKRYRMNAN
jgi:hypothetical protein